MKRQIIPNATVKLTALLTVKVRIIEAAICDKSEYWLIITETNFQYKKGEYIIAKTEDIKSIKTEL